MSKSKNLQLGSLTSLTNCPDGRKPGNEEIPADGPTRQVLGTSEDVLTTVAVSCTANRERYDSGKDQDKVRCDEDSL